MDYLDNFGYKIDGGNSQIGYLANDNYTVTSFSIYDSDVDSIPELFVEGEYFFFENTYPLDLTIHSNTKKDFDDMVDFLFDRLEGIPAKKAKIYSNQNQ